MIKCVLRITALIALLMGCYPAALAAAADQDEPVVEVMKAGKAIVIEASMLVPASLQETWAVLTDYDHMARFSPNLRSSRVIAKSGRVIQVAQEGSIVFGPFSIPFESVREIELKPFSEIRSRAVSGSLKSGTAITRLSAEGRGVRIVYYSESVPNVWTPPGIGTAFIARQTGAQFENLRAEILRRKGR